MNNPAIFVAVTLPFILTSCGEGNVRTPSELVVCTQDAMQCPDGSWVARSGPKCEFVCPQSKAK